MTTLRDTAKVTLRWPSGSVARLVGWPKAMTAVASVVPTYASSLRLTRRSNSLAQAASIAEAQARAIRKGRRRGIVILTVEESFIL